MNESAPLRGIGGSDIAAVLGISKWKSPFDVWAKLVGQAPEIEQNQAMEWGTILEPVVARHYTQGHPGEFLTQPGRLAHPHLPYVCGTPDFLVHSGEDTKLLRGLEIKTAGLRAASFWGSEGDAIPEEYLVQCAWYMIVTGLETWDVAVLLGGQEYREYTLVADQELQKLLLAQAAQFWAKHVLTGLPPEPGGSESTAHTIRSLYPRSIANMKTATPEECVVAGLLQEAEMLLAEAESQHAALKAKLMLAMGESEALLGPWGRISWKSSKPSDVVDRGAIIADLTTRLAEALKDGDAAQAALADLQAKHTTTKPGSRRFLTRWGK